MQVLITLKLELVQQQGRWEACEGCPAKTPELNINSLCHFLSRQANEQMGGFSYCGDGATWRIAK